MRHNAQPQGHPIRDAIASLLTQLEPVIAGLLSGLLSKALAQSSNTQTAADAGGGAAPGTGDGMSDQEAVTLWVLLSSLQPALPPEGAAALAALRLRLATALSDFGGSPNGGAPRGAAHSA